MWVPTMTCIVRRNPDLRFHTQGCGLETFVMCPDDSEGSRVRSRVRSPG